MKSPHLILLGSAFLLALGSPLASAGIDDIDNDGIADSVDTDRDGDGLSNFMENAAGTNPNVADQYDIDGDGIPDSIDSDQDGDGVLDKNDDFPRDATGVRDTDGDGIPDNRDKDIDGDKISNKYEQQLGFAIDDANKTPSDYDKDGWPDVLDSDMDNDGYENAQDAFPLLASEWSDLDEDGEGDNTDKDWDGDGITNEWEVKLGTDARDPSSFPVDLDGDGIPDENDSDRDGDGIADVDDLYPDDPRDWADTDKDGLPDGQDQDADGDGIPNVFELHLGTDPLDASSHPKDTDGDSMPDPFDTDRDGDGFANTIDAYPDDIKEWGDLDGDGIGDNADTDRDNDGFPNDDEIAAGSDDRDPKSLPGDLDKDGIADVVDEDIDGDGHLNAADVFPRNKTDWADLDKDGIGDNADGDRDGDTINNDYELRLGFDPDSAVSVPTDLDKDAIPDALDEDIDGDFIANALDMFPLNKNEWLDYDGDGQGNNGDLDRDGDNISNEYERLVGTNDLDAKDVPVDQDGDRIPDRLDDNRDGDEFLNTDDAFPDNKLEWADMDSDGRGDNSDLDVDGDRISNKFEIQLGFNHLDATSTPPDMDGDTTPDALDDDKDGDDVTNLSDKFPMDATEWIDMDADGTGDNSDLDRDGDRISNHYELTLLFDPSDASSTPVDSDADGIPDALDKDRDGDNVDDVADLFPDNIKEWADLDKDGTGDNGDKDRDGDGYNNRYEVIEKTNPSDFFSFPDHVKPIVEKASWQNSTSLVGMAFDDGMGVSKVWLEDSSGQVWPGHFLYASHFKVNIEGAVQGKLSLILLDKAGNRGVKAMNKPPAAPLASEEL
jgi:hypothetical protein